MPPDLIARMATIATKGLFGAFAATKATEKDTRQIMKGQNLINRASKLVNINNRTLHINFY